MIFLAPFFLIGLLALAVPVIIHLWSKNTKNSVSFGSIRFLEETETKTMRSLMPSQWLLLMSRLLVLTLLVFILAEAQFNKSTDPLDTLYLVDTSYEGEEWLTTLRDTLTGNDEALWLAKNFPGIDLPAPQESKNYWHLLSQPPAKAGEVIVLSPLLLKDFYGVVKPFPVKYQWIKLPTTPEIFQLVTYQKNDQSLTVETKFDEWTTSHKLTQGEGGPPLLFTYYLEAGTGFDGYEEIFEAAITTLNTLSPLTIQETDNLAQSDWVIWLSNDQSPIRKGIIYIDSLAVDKWNEIIPGIIHISADWSQEEAIRINLPQKLIDVFCKELAHDQSDDMRTIDIQSFRYLNDVKIDDDVESMQGGMYFIWIGLLLMIMTERWLAFKSARK